MYTLSVEFTSNERGYKFGKVISNTENPQKIDGKKDFKIISIETEDNEEAAIMLFNALGKKPKTILYGTPIK